MPSYPDVRQSTERTTPLCLSLCEFGHRGIRIECVGRTLITKRNRIALARRTNYGTVLRVPTSEDVGSFGGAAGGHLGWQMAMIERQPSGAEGEVDGD